MAQTNTIVICRGCGKKLSVTNKEGSRRRYALCPVCDSHVKIKDSAAAGLPRAIYLEKATAVEEHEAFREDEKTKVLVKAECAEGSRFISGKPLERLKTLSAVRSIREEDEALVIEFACDHLRHETGAEVSTDEDFMWDLDSVLRKVALTSKLDPKSLRKDSAEVVRSAWVEPWILTGGKIEARRHFRGCVIESVNFKALECDSDIVFEDCLFTGDVSIESDVARDERTGATTSFVSRFHQKLVFERCVFAGNIGVRNIVCDDGVLVKDCTVHGFVQASDLRAAQDLIIKRSSLRGELDVRRARIEDFSLKFSRLGSRVLGSELRTSGETDFSHAFFCGSIDFHRAQFRGCDVLGANFLAPAYFLGASFSGVVRFGLDYHTFELYERKGEQLLSLYGITRLAHLVTRVSADMDFSNSLFEQGLFFDRVEFGKVDGERPKLSFVNTQFLGETHFDRIEKLDADLDFTTCVAEELTFNASRIEGRLILDDAFVKGRITLAGTEFGRDSTLSFYSASLSNFSVYQDIHLEKRDESADVSGRFSLVRRWRQAKKTRLFYKNLIDDLESADDYDLRIRGLEDTSGKDLEIEAMNRSIQEFVLLKESFERRGMGNEQDWAFWNLSNIRCDRDFEQSLQNRNYIGAVLAKLKYYVFGKAFGWGIRLGNIGITSIAVILIFAFVLHLVGLSGVKIEYDHVIVSLADTTMPEKVLLSFHSFFNVLYGDWTPTETAPLLKFALTFESIVGIVLTTFFVGAYTRKVLH
ncbi:MAG: hypothetical protein NUW37_09085 [Planctomycetes bacterium]|nr:hypothetical protein [Planctomycetota bacterium]